MAQWPSAELKPPTPRRAWIMTVLWWLLFALGIVAVLGGIWTSIEQVRSPTGFDRAGLAVGSSEDCVQVMPWTRSANRAWPDGADSIGGGCVVRIGETAVPASSASRDMVGKLLDGPVGTEVTVALVREDGTTAEAQFPRVAPRWYDLAILAVDTLVATLYPLVALLLWLRRRHDPVSRRISFAFLLIGHLGRGAMAFWGGTEAYYLLAAIGALVAVMTLPAYPNGVYVPRVARWLQVLPWAALAAIGIDVVATGGAATGVVLVGIALLLPIGLIMFVVRYFRMPRGLEKQQVKYAVLGIAAGVVLMIVGYAVAASPDAADMKAGTLSLFYVAGDLIEVLGFAAIPAGVGISLLEYRLNDADAAVGKSVGYAIVTVIVGAAWAVLQVVVGDAAKAWFNNPAITAGITTVLAALVFTPTRSYVLAWTEATFQPALVHLRKLPEKLVRWQMCSAPDELAELVLSDLVPGVGAAHAAILGDDGSEWRVLATCGVAADQAMGSLSKGEGAGPEDLFPIRIELADQIGQPDLLAIGPRSDGASFTADERSAIALIVGPLSNALQTAALRERHTRKIEDSLAGIDLRLGKIEEGLGSRRARGA